MFLIEIKTYFNKKNKAFENRLKNVDHFVRKDSW